MTTNETDIRLLVALDPFTPSGKAEIGERIDKLLKGQADLVEKGEPPLSSSVIFAAIDAGFGAQVANNLDLIDIELHRRIADYLLNSDNGIDLFENRDKLVGVSVDKHTSRPSNVIGGPPPVSVFELKTEGPGTDPRYFVYLGKEMISTNTDLGELQDKGAIRLAAVVNARSIDPLTNIGPLRSQFDITLAPSIRAFASPQTRGPIASGPVGR